MRLLITGCHGFISRAFGRYAKAQGHVLYGIGRGASPPPFWDGDYQQSDYSAGEIEAIVREFHPTALIHGAGSSSVSLSFDAPLEDFCASALVWANVLDGVRRSRLNPVVLFPSSAAVYGNPLVIPVREGAPSNPISPYGFHKATSEILAKEYASCFQLDVVSCRLFSVYGEGQKRLLIWELFNQLNGPGAQLKLQGTGVESRDYLHIDDVASAFVEIIERRTHQEQTGNFTCINVARGKSITVVEVARKLCAMLGIEKEILTGKDFRRGDPSKWEADISVLEQAAPGWCATDFDESLEKCLKVWLTECGN
ncbi:MAG: UDP-glucose 4-epimerase [Blastocatellia bacterium]|nr:UDP-glucose 4-epimerase [Blastocatellia bacterium]